MTKCCSKCSVATIPLVTIDAEDYKDTIKKLVVAIPQRVQVKRGNVTFCEPCFLGMMDEFIFHNIIRNDGRNDDVLMRTRAKLFEAIRRDGFKGVLKAFTDDWAEEQQRLMGDST